MANILVTCCAEAGTRIKMNSCAMHAAAYLHISNHGSTDEAVTDSHLRQQRTSAKQPCVCHYY